MKPRIRLTTFGAHMVGTDEELLEGLSNIALIDQLRFWQYFISANPDLAHSLVVKEWVMRNANDVAALHSDRAPTSPVKLHKGV